ncbi:MAG: DUF2085 domain-containing protein [Bacteroidota bacterium]
MPQPLTPAWKSAWPVLAGGMLMMGAVVLPALVSPEARVMLMSAFEAVCHQIPERSPHLAGVQLGVCHRCFGIYAGVPLMAFAMLWWRHREQRGRWLQAGLALLALPMILDWAAGALGWWPNTAASRVITGGIWGLSVGWVLVSTLGRQKKEPSG